MAENESAIGASAPAEGAEGTAAAAAEGTETAEGAAEETTEAVPPEEITYHAVEKDGEVSAIWEMQGRKHLRTIDPRSRQGLEILRLYTADHQ